MVREIIKLVVALFILAAVNFSQAQATIIKGYERPILHAENMKIISTKFGFQHAKKISITLTQRDKVPHATGINISFQEPNHTVHTPWAPGPNYQILKIVEEYENDCGSTVYRAIRHRPLAGRGAKLPNRNIMAVNGKLGSNQRRFIVELVDHSTYAEEEEVCEDTPATRWEAKVIRSAGGFCGTQDAVMHVQGEPFGVATPESLP